MTRRTGLSRYLFDRRVLDAVTQVAVVGGLCALIWYFVSNASDQLVRGGIASGFDFLWRSSGVDVPVKLIAHTNASSYANLLLVGVLNTLLVSAIGIVIATVLGFAIGIARLSRNWLLARLCGAFIEFVRNIPLLFFVLAWYFVIVNLLPPLRQSLSPGAGIFLNNRGLYIPWPDQPARFLAVPAALAVGAALVWLVRRFAAARRAKTGRGFPVGTVGATLLLGLPAAAALGAGFASAWDVPVRGGFNFRGGVVLIPEFVAIVVALATYTAGFIAEIVRGGILAVGKGQIEAAQALGLKRGEILRLIVVPQAMRAIVPPLTSQYLNLIKNSSFGAFIAFPETVSVFLGSTLTQTGQAIEIAAITLAIYLAISLAVSALMNWYNRFVAIPTR